MNKLIFNTLVSDTLDNIGYWEKITFYKPETFSIIIEVNSESLDDSEKSIVLKLSDDNKLNLEYAVSKKFIGYTEGSNIYKLPLDLFRKIMQNEFMLVDYSTKLNPEEGRRLIKCLCLNGSDIIPFNGSFYIRGCEVDIIFDGVVLKQKK
jgi:hypothetical protein